VKTFTDGHALKYLQSPRSDENGKKKEKVFLRKRLTVFGPFDGLWSVGTRFRH